mmetsp:Transcript_42362/g.72966  ORF Transcript_42362/g.72966 Transcript_42362/m.72966 type:complete len:180 (+) Transcript_42362:72-611(+)|eukprot:CAMPEP_0194560092 /NCGR_PEP_ID=MMETSP0292-20121207/1401_1 /TAXON_ID=39354 /ORGANISM="Heterosigma akashiwo, Strain CCMP2393" /LENGTH=179 /DNA_ID=CAMNT_0039408183 /DNA_START=67 /DNA_END=606 /DNA_ORIENTATION=-
MHLFIKVRWLIPSLVFLGLVVSTLSEDLIVEKTSCEELGFADNLLCTTCAHIATIVADEDLVTECQSCCKEPPTVATTKYRKAILEVGQQVIHFYREVAEFIKTPLKEMPNGVEIRYTFRSRPQLLLYNEEDKEPAEVVSISRWKKDSITEFLKERLLAGEETTNLSEEDSSLGPKSDL